MSTAPALDKVRAQAIDLNTGYPRSAKETLADYAIAARAVDKCRAELAGINGEYHYACPLTKIWTDWAEIDIDALRTFVATGATDGEIATWVRAHAKPRERAEILRWSNQWREKKLSELDDRLLQYMEDYIQENCPPGAVSQIKTWFDVYDVEEKRIPV